jgi:hypothetical protein
MLTPTSMKRSHQRGFLTTKILSDCLSEVSYSLEVLSENDPDLQ